MGVETAVAVPTSTPTPTPTATPTPMPTKPEPTLCVCGVHAAVKGCDACGLRYCDECSARRHRHGAFARHVVTAYLPPTDMSPEDSDTRGTTASDMAARGTRASSRPDKAQMASVPCDECHDHSAVVSCTACELRYCRACADVVHQHGTMQCHERNGSYVMLRQKLVPWHVPDDERSHVPERRVAHVVDKLLQDDTAVRVPPASSSSLKSPFFTVGRDDDHGTDDPDQELSPTPPTRASPPSDSSTASSSSYDLWGSWSVRSFAASSERASLTSPPPLSGSSDWRGFRSLSIDASPASPPLSLDEDDDATSLSSISRSLRSMSFASSADDMGPPPEKRSLRPRSFSDYTSLGSVKLHDIWNERVPQLEAPAAKRSVGEELFRSMKTTVASRHVIIRSQGEAFNSLSLRRVIDTLSAYGPIASIREEFTKSGVLFCTFFQLKAAIGAVKLWFTNNMTRAGASETSAYFCVPYEAPNEINCATLLVQVHGPTLVGGSSDMRQLCSRYGEIASVLEQDGDEMGPNPFLVEFNDSRDVAAAQSRLSGVLLSSGHMVSASRSHPPTFDSSKIQAFQRCVDALATQHAPPMTNRPKSYSESTSILTSPSSTSSSSPLHGSLFETRSSGFRQMTDVDANVGRDKKGAETFHDSVTSSRSTSPFTPQLTTSGNAWSARAAARPRSSSAFASLPSESTSAMLADAFASPPARPSRFMNPHGSQYRQPSGSPAATHPSYQGLNSQTLMMQGRLGPIRSGSDPGFRASYAASTTSSTSSIGRNDQGTGEYCLSIEKVAAGDDKRTTLMVRNIPNKYTQQMLLTEINEHHHGQYDFFYLPIDFKNKCNMGYAFINFIEAESIVSFYQEFDSQKWTNFNSEKVCAISYARLQGKQAMITRFQNSSLLEKHESYRPLVFYSSGPNQGKPEPFPSPKPPPQHQHQHQHSYAHQFANKKMHHQNHHHHHPSQHHPQMLMTPSDEYVLAAHAGRLYAHQHPHQHQHQHQQQLHHAAHVLHGHALLANAHAAAAAAAMLHTMPGLGMQPPQYAPSPRSFQYGHAYQHHTTAGDRRNGPPYVNGAPSRGPTHSAFGSFSGTSYSSSSTQS